jgi:hypothetical protein
MNLKGNECSWLLQRFRRLMTGSVKGSVGQLVPNVHKIFSFGYIFTFLVRNLWTINETVLYLSTWCASDWEEFMPRSWHGDSLTNSKISVDNSTFFFVKMGHIWHSTIHVYPLLQVSNFFECIECIISFRGPNPLLCQDIIPFAVGLDDWQLDTLTPTERLHSF